MATQKPQIRSTFATPLCVHFLPIAAEANAELRPLILDRMNHAEFGSAARGSGWRSANDFESWGGGTAQTLVRVLRELADGITSTRSGGRISVEWNVSAHACVRQAGEGEARAARPGAFWSAVYVVDDGYAKSDDAALGGEFELIDPRGPLPAMVSPQYAFRIPGGGSAGMSEAIRPQSGMIVLHPSWQPRGERRYDGNNHRITIEFDLAS